MRNPGLAFTLIVLVLPDFLGVAALCDITSQSHNSKEEWYGNFTLDSRSNPRGKWDRKYRTRANALGNCSYCSGASRRPWWSESVPVSSLKSAMLERVWHFLFAFYFISC